MLTKAVMRWALAVALGVSLGLAIWHPAHARAADDSVRKVKSKIQAAYPELARRMNLMGTVKLEVVVTADGAAKDVKPMGGNPVLIQAATDAVKRWRWEPGGQSTEVVEFHFTKE